MDFRIPSHREPPIIRDSVLFYPHTFLQKIIHNNEQHDFRCKDWNGALAYGLLGWRVVWSFIYCISAMQRTEERECAQRICSKLLMVRYSRIKSDIADVYNQI